MEKEQKKLDKNIQLLLQYRKQFEKPFRGKFAIIKNNVRMHYLNNVDEKIKHREDELHYLELMKNGDVSAMYMLIYMNGSGPVLAKRDDESPEQMSMQVELLSGYKEILKLNVAIADKLKCEQISNMRGYHYELKYGKYIQNTFEVKNYMISNIEDINHINYQLIKKIIDKSFGRTNKIQIIHSALPVVSFDGYKNKHITNLIIKAVFK